jgi:hypothetical protein
MKRNKPLPWKFSADAKANERLRSVQRVIRAIVRVDDILESHRRELLPICMYRITEAHGKWNLRYKSLATKGKPRKEVTHEHVIARKELVTEILKIPQRSNKSRRRH